MIITEAEILYSGLPSVQFSSLSREHSVYLIGSFVLNILECLVGSFDANEKSFMLFHDLVVST